MVDADKTALLMPLRPARNRTTEVIERITGEIASGVLSPGARLPTEHQLMTAFSVSRTVVREAVSALKADGLVVTRQGAGAFVSSDGARVPFRIDPEGLSSIDDVIKLMELRLAVEVEAAGLAAERGSLGGVRAIERALVAVDRAIASGKSAIAEDFAFHQAIANATGNPNFREFLVFLGRHVIPRQSIRLSVPSTSAYLQHIQVEHRVIAAAIASHDAKRARRAMRAHLEKSLRRYSKVAEQVSKSVLQTAVNTKPARLV